jgi:hypothetical protein
MNPWLGPKTGDSMPIAAVIRIWGEYVSFRRFAHQASRSGLLFEQGCAKLFAHGRSAYTGILRKKGIVCNRQRNIVPGNVPGTKGRWPGPDRHR